MLHASILGPVGDERVQGMPLRMLEQLMLSEPLPRTAWDEWYDAVVVRRPLPEDDRHPMEDVAGGD